MPNPDEEDDADDEAVKKKPACKGTVKRPAAAGKRGWPKGKAKSKAAKVPPQEEEPSGDGSDKSEPKPKAKAKARAKPSVDEPDKSERKPKAKAKAGAKPSVDEPDKSEPKPKAKAKARAKPCDDEPCKSEPKPKAHAKPSGDEKPSKKCKRASEEPMAGDRKRKSEGDLPTSRTFARRNPPQGDSLILWTAIRDSFYEVVRPYVKAPTKYEEFQVKLSSQAPTSLKNPKPHKAKTLHY